MTTRGGDERLHTDSDGEDVHGDAEMSTSRMMKTRDGNDVLHPDGGSLEYNRSKRKMHKCQKNKVLLGRIRAIYHTTQSW